ncbi:hypothetical protein B1C78_16040 [Thioalkalivibrio denitrificans]|uniref:Uncharacterized protein n=1 Tax=Thioalkalivibrio denitrificans TaxID=108003 RepID=A0A1V3N9Q7_9GAMM|nr:hypothetical protein [Thioalkalivibrio denitrificans]OOG21790.1 hypothetical protein B1C78_16040 [Thioalkalivibrio denitrificans]
MSESPDNPRKEPAGTDQSAPRQGHPNARRRNLIRGAMATPLVVTLASRPVWGSQGACSLSGDIFSANVSDIDHECTAGQGCTPGYWRNNYKGWACTGFSPGTCMELNPSGNKCQKLDATTGTTFEYVFGYAPMCGSVTTLMEVLQECPGTLDWHAVGAALNARCTSIYYGASLAEVVQAYQMARDNPIQTDPELLKNVFDNMNNRGCPIDAHGNCEKGYTLEDDVCIPVKTSLTLD